ncbi:unnamed protein product [Gemmata massiliana]|uniref:Peptidase S1 domain-containing protein n=1 Tax=Gemmata massiliana TaxID=1210884 RepID=A0A6P2D177_9BACT|nr:hypothetical protein [Gemmata massiliana]VTR94336.1 unnamed protein product [Gemmata massiliana]
MNIPKPLLEKMNAANAKAAEFARSCTVSFMLDDGERAWLVGSGILFEVATKAFILTASHVFQKQLSYMYRHHTVFLSVGKPGVQPIKLDQVVGFFSASEGNTAPTKSMDIAFMDLSEKTADALRAHMRFLHLSDVDISPKDKPRAIYLTYGYPNSLVDEATAKSGSVRYAPLHLVSDAYRGDRGEVPGHKPDEEIVVNYDPKTSENHLGDSVELPDPRGASGCGMWRMAYGIADFEKWDTAMMKLVAIEHIRNDKVHVLRGGRISYLVAELAARHPDLVAAIQLNFPGWKP